MRRLALGAPLLAAALLASACIMPFTTGDEPSRDGTAPHDASSLRDASPVHDARTWPDAAIGPDGAVAPDSAVDGGAPTAKASCLEHLQAGATQSGAYEIDPDGEAGPRAPFTVLCDMATDGGGWTVLANNNNDDVESSGCIPRLATEASLVCGDPPTGVTADFSLPAWGLPFTELVWAAYDDTLQAVAYRAFLWSTQQELPNQATWSLTAEVNDHVIPGYDTLPLISCDWNALNTLQMVTNAPPSRDGAYLTTDTLTFFDGDADPMNLGRMSFTDENTNNGVNSLSGLDDFQDGMGCSDDWSPKAYRGHSSLIMVR